MGGSFVRLWLRLACIVAGALALFVHPNAAWVESAYANGSYAAWQRLISPLTLALPFSLGDVAGLAGIAIVLWLAVRGVRAARARKEWRPLVSMLLSILALAGLYAVWFEASWGWNYDRAPLENRVAYDARAAAGGAVDRLRARTIERMNALAPLAHARAGVPLDQPALLGAWIPVVQRLGDSWEPNVGRFKRSIADPFMTATGTSGFINPFTLETQLASDVLWFEEPFDVAHEWTHVAAFAREDEANYVAAVTCIRSRDPVIAYSGWLEIFLYLPPLEKYDRKMFSALVWQDFAALRARNARHLNLSLSRLSWRAYNAYLKTNHVANGIANYDEVTRLLLAVPLDPSGLPVIRGSHETYMGR
jgi:hypothetical protein